jgi:hypothetical protein
MRATLVHPRTVGRATNLSSGHTVLLSEGVYGAWGVDVMRSNPLDPHHCHEGAGLKHGSSN